MAQLPLGADDRFNQYTATAGQTDFDFSFPLFGDPAGLDVWRTRAGVTEQLLLTSDYAVNNADQAAGSITLAAGALAGDVYTLIGNQTIELEQLFQERKPLDIPLLNELVKRLFAVLQELRRDLNRTPVLPPQSAASVSPQLPDPTDPANLGFFIGFDGTGYTRAKPGDPGAVSFSAFGETYVMAANAMAALNLLGVSAYMQGVLDAADAAAARASLGVNWGNLTGRPGILPQAEGAEGTAQTERTVTAERLRQTIQAHAPAERRPFVNADLASLSQYEQTGIPETVHELVITLRQATPAAPGAIVRLELGHPGGYSTIGGGSVSGRAGSNLLPGFLSSGLVSLMTGLNPGGAYAWSGRITITNVFGGYVVSWQLSNSEGSTGDFMSDGTALVVVGPPLDRFRLTLTSGAFAAGVARVDTITL